MTFNNVILSESDNTSDKSKDLTTLHNTKAPVLLNAGTGHWPVLPKNTESLKNPPPSQLLIYTNP